MVDESGVNTQITESVIQVHKATADQTPAQSLALLDRVMAETLGMGMHNAITAQRNSQLTASAAITATCARMINSQASTVSSASDEDKAGDTPVPPLTPTDPVTKLAAAQQETDQAVNIIKKASQMVKQTATQAKNALIELGKASDDPSPPATNATPSVNPAKT